MTTKRKGAVAILGQTWGWSSSEVREYEYQPGRTGTDRIFTVGNTYYCVSSRRPKYGAGELNWEPAGDQAIAKMHNTVIWKARV